MQYKHNIDLPDINEFRRYEPAEIADVVSNDPGFYIWWSRSPIVPVYIGAALNRRGLFGRVIRQHLCPTYLELRPEKTVRASMHADYKGRKAAEKSVFRKKISNKFSLLPGSKCVEFIMGNFLISLIPMANVLPICIKDTERLLIEIHQPEFNTLFVGINKSNKNNYSDKK